MKRAEFEQRVLSLWVTSRVPMTAVHLQLYTGLTRARLLALLDELVTEQILEVDSDDLGELLWTVPGTARAPEGLARIEDVQRLEQLRAQVVGAASRTAAPRTAAPRTAARAQLATRSEARALAPSGDRKSLIASGLLSFFLGPLGWLYAGPLGEALPALLVYLLGMAILPGFVLKPLLAILAPLSAAVGALYAWRHNARGERSSLVELGRSAASARRLLGPPRDE